MCGPPCAGKTTYAYGAAGATGRVLDQDVMGRQEFDRAITALCGSPGPDVYVVRCLPGAGPRAEYAAMIGADHIVLLNPGLETCLARARARRDRGASAAAVRSWYAAEARGGGTVGRDVPVPRPGWLHE